MYAKEHMTPSAYAETWHTMKFYSAAVLLLTLWFAPSAWAIDFANKSVTQWSPYLEWSVSNPSYSGNPFDVIASATFVHNASGETHTTEMFYNGGTEWKFRFTGTRTGDWSFTTSSSDPELNNHTGTITVTANSNSNAKGFVTHDAEKWTRSATKEAFVPQFVMYADIPDFYNNPSKIDSDIQTFLTNHGFTGFHIQGSAVWFDINEKYNTNIATPDPDFRTFEAVELLISKVHEAGGTVHIWAWGDDERGLTPTRWGVNGTEDKRLQRYIAARLGPLPGWTMGYGFDNFEWVTGTQLQEWHNYMHAHFGWPHLLGARASKNQLNQLYEGLDYSGYEQHHPDYNKYVETIQARPSKPSFSEDRYRIRNQGRTKDYTEEETRRGLWHSAMAGGVANIWGNLLSGSQYQSDSYQNPEWIKTNSAFFAGRFSKDLTRCNTLTDGVCLKGPGNERHIFYKEGTTSLQMDLSGMSGSQPAVAVDTLKPYAEISLGDLDPSSQTWTAPYASDWAIAVGTFPGVNVVIDTTIPSAPLALSVD